MGLCLEFTFADGRDEVDVHICYSNFISYDLASVYLLPKKYRQKRDKLLKKKFAQSLKLNKFKRFSCHKLTCLAYDVDGTYGKDFAAILFLNCINRGLIVLLVFGNKV